MHTVPESSSLTCQLASLAQGTMDISERTELVHSEISYSMCCNVATSLRQIVIAYFVGRANLLRAGNNRSEKIQRESEIRLSVAQESIKYQIKSVPRARQRIRLQLFS